MRILIAGNFQFEWYEEACALALEEIGCSVIRFSWQKYFSSFIGKAELFTNWTGPLSLHANDRLIQIIAKNNVDLVLVWRGIHIDDQTIYKIRKVNSRCLIISYNNDDPFSPLYTSHTAPVNQLRLWNRFKRAIRSYDINFVYRQVNLKEYQSFGSPKTHVLMPYFLPELHFPRQLTSMEQDKYRSDVVFIGHYENDGRDLMLRSLVKSGINLRIYGNGWPRLVVDSISPSLMPIRPVLGIEYTKALRGAKICLSFLSKLNRDTYTRRSVEIPACSCAMLSERTNDLVNLFSEDIEAMYFSDEQELLTRVQYLLDNDDYRLSIANAAFKRVWRDGHDVKSRMKQMLNIISQKLGS